MYIVMARTFHEDQWSPSPEQLFSQDKLWRRSSWLPAPSGCSTTPRGERGVCAGLWGGAAVVLPQPTQCLHFGPRPRVHACPQRTEVPSLLCCPELTGRSASGPGEVFGARYVYTQNTVGSPLREVSRMRLFFGWHFARDGLLGHARRALRSFDYRDLPEEVRRKAFLCEAKSCARCSEVEADLLPAPTHQDDQAHLTAPVMARQGFAEALQPAHALGAHSQDQHPRLQAHPRRR